MSNGRICLVDDDAAVRESLEALLASEGFEVTAFGSAAEFLAGVDRVRPDCLLLDVRMPDMDGITLLEELARREADLPTVMMTGHADLPMAIRALRAGAKDFVEKPIGAGQLFECLRRATGQVRRRRIEGEATLAMRFAELTPRETEVMRQMVVGLPNKLIAHTLDMSPRTVEIHRARVMKKTGARSLSHLVRMAVRAGHDPDDDGHKEDP